MEGDSQSNQEKMREMLDRRHKERKLVSEQVKSSAKNEKSKVEGIDYFENSFDEKICEIENRLNELKPECDVQELTNVFYVINCDIQELQKYLTNSTLFLNDYTIKKYQNLLNQLIAKADETKNRLIPKKKFGFKKKTDVKSPSSSKTLEDHIDAGAKKAHTRKEFLWTISKKRNERIILNPEETNDQDITISDLENCVVQIFGHPGSLQLSKITNCVITCGPVARSVFADNCQDCKFSFSCQQLRLHSSKFCCVYLHVTSRAVMEDCTDITFAPHNFGYENYQEDLASAGLDPKTNNWQLIGDFNWLSADQASPNWSVVKDCDRITDWICFMRNFSEKFSIN